MVPFKELRGNVIQYFTNDSEDLSLKTENTFVNQNTFLFSSPFIFLVTSWRGPEPKVWSPWWKAASPGAGRTVKCCCNTDASIQISATGKLTGLLSIPECRTLACNRVFFHCCTGTFTSVKSWNGFKLWQFVGSLTPNSQINFYSLF